MAEEPRLPWKIYKHRKEAEELAEKVGDVVFDIIGRRPKGDDGYVHRLQKTIAPDIHGLVALKIEWRERELTVITATGRFFNDPDLRFQLDRLKQEACRNGRFALLIERRTFLKRLDPASTPHMPVPVLTDQALRPAATR